MTTGRDFAKHAQRQGLEWTIRDLCKRHGVRAVLEAVAFNSLVSSSLLADRGDPKGAGVLLRQHEDIRRLAKEIDV